MSDYVRLRFQQQDCPHAEGDQVVVWTPTQVPLGHVRDERCRRCQKVIDTMWIEHKPAGAR